MMLDIETFDNLRGGNVAYKALAHPLAAERLAAWPRRRREVAIFDPDGIAGPLLALCPDFDVEGVYVQDTLALGKMRGGHAARALTELAHANVKSVLIAAFDGQRTAQRLASFAPQDARILTLDGARLPEAMLTNKTRYLESVNFATNFVFFRDDGHFATRLTTANYWSGYGAKAVRFFHRLYAAHGRRAGGMGR